MNIDFTNFQNEISNLRFRVHIRQFGDNSCGKFDVTGQPEAMEGVLDPRNTKLDDKIREKTKQMLNGYLI